MRAYAAAWNLRTVMTGSLPLTRAYRKREPMPACPSTSHPARGRYQPHPNERRPTRGVATPSCAGCICSTATSKSSTTDRACPRGLCWPVTTWQSWQHGSLPLARALRELDVPARLQGRVILARTDSPGRRPLGSTPASNHPHLHGLYPITAAACALESESLPLARALLRTQQIENAKIRVTPARAGATLSDLVVLTRGLPVFA